MLHACNLLDVADAGDAVLTAAYRYIQATCATSGEGLYEGESLVLALVLVQWYLIFLQAWTGSLLSFPRSKVEKGVMTWHSCAS